MLVKKRFELTELPPGARPRLGRPPGASPDRSSAGGPTLFDVAELDVPEVPDAGRGYPALTKPKPLPRARIDALLAALESAKFDDAEIGRAVREVAQGGTPEQLANFVKQLRALIP
jgi:hypothetical protein